MRFAAAIILAGVMAGCGGTDSSSTKEMKKDDSGKAAVATAPAKPAGTIVKRPTAASQPRNLNDVPQVFSAGSPDGAKASIAADSAQTRVAEEIMANRVAARKSAVPFTRNAIPDPDDRANMPYVPVVPDSMPAVPVAK